MVLGSRPPIGYRTLAVVALVVLAGCAGGLSGGGASEETGQQSGQAGGDGPGGSVGSYYADDGDRVLIRKADMDLRVDNFSRALGRLRTIARAHGGYIGDRSQRSEGEYDSGDVTVRVPARNFSDARDDIAAVGKVERENVRVLDFTGEFEDRKQRIAQLERDERELERLLANTTDTNEAVEVRNELQEVRGQLRELKQRQSSLRQREALSTVRIDLHEPESRKPPRNFESSFGFVDAFLGAFYGGLTAVKYVIVFFGYAIPAGIALVALGVFGSVLYLSWKRLFYRIRAGFTGVLGAPADPNTPDGRGPGPTGSHTADDQAGAASGGTAEHDATGGGQGDGTGESDGTDGRDGDDAGGETGPDDSGAEDGVAEDGTDR